MNKEQTREVAFAAVQRVHNTGNRELRAVDISDDDLSSVHAYEVCVDPQGLWEGHTVTVTECPLMRGFATVHLYDMADNLVSFSVELHSDNSFTIQHRTNHE